MSLSQAAGCLRCLGQLPKAIATEVLIRQCPRCMCSVVSLEKNQSKKRGFNATKESKSELSVGLTVRRKIHCVKT